MRVLSLLNPVAYFHDPVKDNSAPDRSEHSLPAGSAWSSRPARNEGRNHWRYFASQGALATYPLSGPV